MSYGYRRGYVISGTTHLPVCAVWERVGDYYAPLEGWHTPSSLHWPAIIQSLKDSQDLPYILTTWPDFPVSGQ